MKHARERREKGGDRTRAEEERGGVRRLLRLRCILARKSTRFRAVGSQYGNFCPVPRYFPGNLQNPKTRPIFAMAKMSPRESQVLALEVVRWAPNLHMYNSTHQDLSFHRECRSVSDGKGWYQCPVVRFIGTPDFQPSPIARRSASSNSSGKSPLTMPSPSVAPRTSSTTARP